jgi:phosphoribosylglycinamide formyltransferase-1
MLRIAVLGSGRGSNFAAIMRALDEGSIPEAQVCVVISNNSGAGILELARSHGLPAVHLSQKQFADEQQFVAALLALLEAHRVNLVVLAGYMKRLHRTVVGAYRNRIVNIHPALLPKFGGPGMYGYHVHEAVIASGQRISGATVHLVDEEYDHGKILLQRTVAVSSGETPESLADRVLRIEHQLYPEALRQIAEGRIKLDTP